MTIETIETRLERLLEQLAEKEHERWAHWQRYVHEQCRPEANGDLVIPAKLVEQWRRQIATPYSELTDEEKDSDREQVRKYLPLVLAALNR